MKIGLLRLNRNIFQNATKQPKIAYCLPRKMYEAFKHWYCTDNCFEQIVIELSLYLLLMLYPKYYSLNWTRVKYCYIGVLRDKESIPHSPSLYIIKAGVACPYPGDCRCLVPGQ